MGVLQAGVVLDTRILAWVQTATTPERLAYHGALVRLAGTDLGSDVKPWSAWWRERQERSAAAAAPRRLPASPGPAVAESDPR